MRKAHVADRTRSSVVWTLAIFGSLWGSASVSAQTLLDPDTQPKFINPLPRPAAIDLRAGGALTMTMRQCGEQWLGLYDPQTGLPMSTIVWGYEPAGGTCTYPGPTIVAQRDVPLDVTWVNGLVDGSGSPLGHLLPVDTSIEWANPLNQDPEDPFSGPIPVVTHLHGGHNESASDGLPGAWFTPGFAITGPQWVKPIYRYDNDQEAGTLWYHDHAHGITRLNVYAGFAGFYLLRDAREDALIAADALPSGAYEWPIVIQDRSFTASGELFYPSTPEVPGHPEPSILPEFFGEVILVNGMAWPVLEVEPRKYRFRFLNGSDSRFYTMRLSDGGPEPFVQIGTDDGFLYQPVRSDTLTFGPGERLDVVVDFSNHVGDTLVLRNTARSPFPKGSPVDPKSSGLLMAFRVSATPVVDNVTLPATLRDEPFAVPTTPGVNVRRVALFEGNDELGRLRPQLGILDPSSPLNGSLRFHDPITENPELGATEVWEIYNATADTHPIHIHLVTFQVLSRQRFRGTLVESEDESGEGIRLTLVDVRTVGNPRPPDPSEQGPKDTVQVQPGEVVRVVASFDRPGRYAWHCHILSHEDNEMMRPYCVGEPGECD